MRCPNCGYRNPEEFHYCGKCGSPLQREQTLKKRWATILFYDVSGYSRYASEHDLEDTHRELNALLRHCQNCVQLHGGQIDKFFGDGMLAVFGASDSRENEPFKAIKAAVCMVRRLQSGSLRGRAGIATGMVMLGPLGGEDSAHQTVIGDVVNLAQRIVSAAPAGSIWLDETTKKLVPEARLRELKARKFKGFSGQTRVWEFRDWGGRPEPLFGRKLELEHILNFIDQLEKGKGKVFKIIGQLGTGKTFLVKEALRLRAGRIKSIIIPKLDVSDPVRLRLRAAFYDNFGPKPMEYFKKLGLSELDRRLLAYALGMESEKPAPLPELEAALVGAMRRALALVAKEKPLVIIAKTGPRDHTLAQTMIKSLNERPIPRVAVIVISRQLEDEADLVLGPLPPRDADAYMRHLNPKLEEDKRKQIYNESKGNPLQIRLLALSDDQAVSVMAAFQSRLDKLSPTLRQTLLYAALGRPTSWYGVLKELIGKEAKEAILQLIKEGYLKSNIDNLNNLTRIEIENQLLQEVANSILSNAESRRVHKTYWRWLIKQNQQRLSAVAAEHALLAGLREEAGRAWIAAGDYQRDYGIFTGADGYYRRAVNEASRKMRLKALRRLAEMHFSAGSAETVLKLIKDINTVWADRLRGLALASLKHNEAAEKILQKILLKHPNDAHVELALINLQPTKEKINKLLILKTNLNKKSNTNEIISLINLRLAESLAAQMRLEEATNIMHEAYRNFVLLNNRSRAAEAALAISGYMWHSERLIVAAEWADRAIEHGRKAHPGIATIAWSVRTGLWLDQALPDEAEKALQQAEVHLEHARNADERARIHAIRLRYLIETGQLQTAVNMGENIFSTLPHPWMAANLSLVHAMSGGRYSNRRQLELAKLYFDKSSPPAKALFLLAQALRIWGEGADPQPYLKKSLKIGKYSGPYLRYLTLALWGIYLLKKDPKRARSLAQFLLRRSTSGGFVAIHYAARLIRAELGLADGEPVAHMLRFDTPFGPQRAWKRSLLIRAGYKDPGGAIENLSGYGILGIWARHSWREGSRSEKNGSA